MRTGEKSDEHLIENKKIENWKQLGTANSIKKKPTEMQTPKKYVEKMLDSSVGRVLVRFRRFLFLFFIIFYWYVYKKITSSIS